MAQLKTKVFLYCEANGKTVDFGKDVLLQNDGSGAYIKEWNVSGLAKPSDSQIASYETAGNAKEADGNIRRARRGSYLSITDQLDLLYKDMVAGKLDTTGEWAKAIKAVKDANPKE
jgi:hypothetical protein|tara:strand:+ start:509 stop:856 length:348 start_codon:yes stop_codon:yes gene_type:complete